MTKRTSKKSQQQLNSIPEKEENEETPIEDVNDSGTNQITKALLTDLLDKQYKKIVTEFNKTIETLKTQLDEVENRATNAEKKIKYLETENQKLKEALQAASTTASKNEQLINAVEERIEDRTNRQLRRTMVFRGVEEEENETWDDTKSLLAAEIAKVTEGVDEFEAEEMLERVHRAAPNTNYKGSAPRPIFAAFYSWPDTVKVIDNFRSQNIAKQTTVTADYKYGPMTSKRRSLAMLERKKLKDNNEIVSGYVAFPARLMVKTSNRQGSKYKLHKDFSKEKVSFKN